MDTCIGRIECFANIESNKSGVVSGEEIFFAFFQFPISILKDFFIAFTGESSSKLLDSMERRGSSIDEFQEFISKEFALFEKLALHV